MSFSYGDKTVTLAGGPQEVTVAVNPLGITAGHEARVAGRWLDSTGHGPTGLVDVKYQPPGRPPMLIMKTGIYGGWINFFALDGVPFSYHMSKTQVPIFKLLQIDFSTGTPRIMV